MRLKLVVNLSDELHIEIKPIDNKGDYKQSQQYSQND
jgi:hypothetical protein